MNLGRFAWSVTAGLVAAGCHSHSDPSRTGSPDGGVTLAIADGEELPVAVRGLVARAESEQSPWGAGDPVVRECGPDLRAANVSREGRDSEPLAVGRMENWMTEPRI
jgi:hypothetical protein